MRARVFVCETETEGRQREALCVHAQKSALEKETETERGTQREARLRVSVCLSVSVRLSVSVPVSVHHTTAL